MIEKYKEEYLNHILKIWLDASVLSHYFVPASYWEGKIGDMKNVYIPASDTYVYLDEQSNVVGFVSLVNNFIAAIFVSPTQQGKGIGKELINYAKSIYPSLELAVYKENESSVQFYKKQGFTVAEEKMEENTGHIELIMTYTN